MPIETESQFMKHPILTVALGLLALIANVAPALAQSAADAAQVDAYVQGSMQKLSIPGVAVARIEEGKTTYLKGYGTIGTSGMPVTAQTPFQLGSISKSFAALVVLQLADEGRLSLDDPLAKHIPDFQTRDKAASDLITLRLLMNHRSGLATIDGNRHQDTVYRGSDAMRRAAQELRSARLIAAPGARFEYSNANYALLAHLIETIEQKPYEAVLDARIFSKLGMRNSYVQVASGPTAAPAAGHTQWFGKTVERDFVAGRMMMGPGGVTASAEDLATYLIAVFEGDPRIIPAALSAALSKERRGGYEFGWEFEMAGDQRVIFHGGLNPGFLAMVKYKPHTRQGAIVLTNMSGSLEGNFTSGATNFMLGLPDTDVSPPAVSLYRLWGALLLAIVLPFACAISLRAVVRRSQEFQQAPALSAWSRIAIPSILLFGLSTFLVFGVPALSGVNLTAVRIFYPDLGLLILFCSTLAAAWAVARTALLIRARLK